MSNAAVINATSTSGQTVGAPISIETGGDVVLKAYGSGEGNWFVVMAFAPVVGGVTGAPVTLTIDYNQPGRQTSAVGTSATEWVGWVLDQGGTWEASGIVEGYQPGEALSDDLGTFASFESLPKYGVKFSARASVLGVQYTYGVDGWAAGGDVVLSINDAASIASAATTTPVNFPIATIKANTIKDRENFSASWLLASSSASGGAFEIQLGGQPIIPSFNYGANDSLYFTAVLSALGTSTRRLRIFGNTYSTVIATLSIDMTQDAPVNIKITPGVGNSVSIKQFSIKRG